MLRGQHPKAAVMVHPECTFETQKVADFVGSTSQMCRYAKQNAADTFIVGTEEGILHRLKKENPSKRFLLAYEGAVCPNMKLNTLERIYASLKKEKNVVTVPKSVSKRARQALDKMFSLA
jgi:quinolinate synthase